MLFHRYVLLWNVSYLGWLFVMTNVLLCLSIGGFWGPSLNLACIQTFLLCAFFTVVVDDIVDVRKGWKTDTFNKIERTVSKKRIRSPGQKSTLDEAACFSVIHGRSKQSLDLVAPNAEVADLWVRGLHHLITVLHGMKQEERFER